MNILNLNEFEALKVETNDHYYRITVEKRELNSVELSLGNILAKISQKTEEEILKNIMNNKKI